MESKAGTKRLPLVVAHLQSLKMHKYALYWFPLFPLQSLPGFVCEEFPTRAHSLLYETAGVMRCFFLMAYLLVSVLTVHGTGLMIVRVSGVCSVLSNLRCRAIMSATVQLDPEGFPSVCVCVCVILLRISHDVTGYNVKIPQMSVCHRM